VRVLIFGAAGMLGHKLLEKLSPRFETFGTLRGGTAGLPAQLPMGNLIEGVEANDLPALAAALDRVRPDVAINCIGIIKQLKQAKDAVPSIRINALLPHQLAELCGERGVRLIHFSTDCVFSGRQGPYTEQDSPDATDLYGRGKLLGELDQPGCLTLRTSIIGPELRHGLSLLAWFLQQRGGRVKGYANALFSGFPTTVMADIVIKLIGEYPGLEGLWHVSSDPIDKYDLLRLINDTYGLGIAIERDEEFHCDRRLDSSRFRAATGYVPPSWPRLVQEMHAG